MFKLLVFFFFISSCTPIADPPALQKPLDGVGVKENLGDSLDMSIPFVDEEGQTVTIKSYTKNDRPLVVMMGYYECPKLCSLVLNGFFAAARSLTWSLGAEYDFIMVSVDPKEDHLLAANKKANYARYYGRSGSDKGIHFLSGKEEHIKNLADALGFQYKYDEKTKQYIHPAVLSVLSPKGKITRYLYGIDFKANDVKLALIEGADNKVGNILERLLLFCYQYDPHAGSYSVTIMNILKISAIFTLFMIAFLIWFLRKTTVQVKA